MVIIKDKNGNVITYASTVQEGRLLIRKSEADDFITGCYTPDFYEVAEVDDEECAPEVKCLSCGHHIVERPLEVYCNIMCKWVNEKDYCTMFEPGQWEDEKTEAQI